MNQIMLNNDAITILATIGFMALFMVAWIFLGITGALFKTSGRSQWQDWEGTIITAVRLAEKEVPPELPDAGLVRLDRAMAHVNKVYREVRRGRRPPRKLASELRERIQILHDEMDRRGSLHRRA